MKVCSLRLFRRKHARGQSTVEFMLMVPILFAMFFFVIEMGLYFTTIHYGNYAAFVTARSVEGGFNPAFPDAKSVAKLVLNGAVWGNATVTPAGPVDAPSGVTVGLTGFERLVPFPFINALLPSMDISAQVNLGQTEWLYEGFEGRPPDQYDNNI